MLEGSPNAQEKLIFFKWLEDVVVGTAANGFQGCGNVVDCRDHDHRHFRIVLPHPFQQPDTVHLRHDHVAQDQVGRYFLNLVLRNAAVLHRRASIPLGLEHGRNDLSNRFLIVHDEYVFHLHVGVPPLVIICDGTPKWGRPCPVRKQRVSVSEGLTLRASRRPHQASRQHEDRNDGNTGREARYGVGESKPARDRFLRSNRLHHLAGSLSPFPPRSPSGLFPFLACRVVLPYIFFLERSGVADSSASRIEFGNRFSADRGLDSLLFGSGALCCGLGAETLVSDSADRLGPGRHLLYRAEKPAAGFFRSFGNRDFRDGTLPACRLDDVAVGDGAPQSRSAAPCRDIPAEWPAWAGPSALAG